MTKNKVWKIVISAVIAIGLWAYVVSTVSPGSEKLYTVAVNAHNLTGLSDEFIITEFEERVNVRLEGNRSDLNALDADSIVIEADLSGIQTAETHKINYMVRPTGNYASNAFVVKNSNPERLTVKVEKKITKTVPVVVVPNGELPEGFSYEKDEIAVSPNQIEVSGPESMVSGIENAVINVDLKDVKDTIDMEYAYDWCDGEMKPVAADPNLVRPENAEAVRVIMPVYCQGQLPLGVNLISGNGLTAESCKVTISPINVLNVYGTPSAMSSTKMLSLGDIELSKIDFEETSVEQTFTLDMTKFEGIHLYEGEDLPDTFTVKVELVNIRTKELKIPASNCKVTVDTDKQFVIQKDVLTVKVRGDAEQIKKLTAEDVTVTLDLTGKSVGPQSVTAKVTLKEEFSKVAVWGKYQVDVDLAKK